MNSDSPASSNPFRRCLQACRNWIIRHPNVAKNLLLYGVGLGLLAMVVASNWNSKLGKATDDQLSTSLVAGGPAVAVAEHANTTPGLGDIFAKPIRPWPLILACLIWIVALVITFVRWYILVRAQDLPFSMWNAMRLGLVSYFFNTFLPGSVGGDILKAVAVAREQSRRTIAVATIIIDRVIGLWALAWLVALSGGVFWAMGNPNLVNNEALKMIVRFTGTIVFSSAVVWSLMGLVSQERSDRFAGRLKHVWKVGTMLSELWRACWMYRRKKKAVAMALGMTIVAHCGWVLIFHLCVTAFPEMEAAELEEHALVVPVGMTAQALFPLPGGVGGGEAAYGWLYTLLGKAATGGILGCIVQRIISWGVGLVGYVIYTRMKRDLPNSTIKPAE